MCTKLKKHACTISVTLEATLKHLLHFGTASPLICLSCVNVILHDFPVSFTVFFETPRHGVSLVESEVSNFLGYDALGDFFPS